MVGTPGRLEDLISTGKLALSCCRFFVLDEAVSRNITITSCNISVLHWTKPFNVNNMISHLT